MSKLCLIFNTPSLYRRPIYQKIDDSYDCSWFFGDWDGGVKGFDTSCLRYPVSHLHVKNPGGKVYYTQGVPSLLRRKEFEKYLMIGDVHDISTWCMLLLKTFHFRSKQVYFWTHGWYGKESLIEKLAKRLFYWMSDGVFLYGSYAKSLMQKEGISSKKLYVVHNSLDYETQLAIRDSLQETNVFQNHFHNTNKNLVFIGRLTESKSLDLLLEAVALLKAKGENYNVTLVGDGAARDGLKKMTLDYSIQDIVWFYGACYDEKTNAEFAFNADICVSPGNVGLTAIHMMMFGTPVITHDAFPYQGPEFEAIKDGVTGSFFHRGDVGSLAKGISDWFFKNEGRRSIIRAACMREIDEKWNPTFQMTILSSVIEK